VQAIIWTAILIGILATILFTQTDDGGLDMFGGRWTMGITIFFAVGGIALAIGAVIMGQEEVLDEKQSGTAAWILSKPVSRTAFIMAKIAANAIGILIILILLGRAGVYPALDLAGQPLSRRSGFLACCIST
jgi:ABC-2 type transport system permease protein